MMRKPLSRYFVCQSLLIAMCISILILFILTHMSRRAIAATIIQIPRNIIQQNSIIDTVKESKLSFLRLNPNHTYLFFNDSKALHFVRKHMPPHIVRVYESLPRTVLKSDLFRYIAVYVLGGVYSDSDTICLRSIDTWTDHKKNVGFIAGIEGEIKPWKKVLARPIQLCQWTFASVPRHPILNRIIEKIASVSQEMKKLRMSMPTIIDWTGPGIWTDTVFDFLNETYHVEWPTLSKLQRGRLIGDVYILPITAFQPNMFFMGSKGEKDREARIKHLFWGSWKKNLPLE
ncbi:hypothetical protein I4U23_005720 [Adineta vaga]|nr:hypothetical protein I4U23_005720 [Adineta vaga]